MITIGPLDADLPPAAASGPTVGLAATAGGPAASRADGEGAPRPAPDPVASMCPPETYEDGDLASLRSRALTYLAVGVPVHFRGRAGMGKTTLALSLAREIDRPVTILTGDDALSTPDLVGREIGQDTTRLRDRYIHSVTRSESRVRAVWSDSVLTRAVAEGHTLVYDEFTRSRPEANNVLLSVLEERVLFLASPLRGERHVQAHPEFRAIFTSNPEEYAGVTPAPDALLDRMITFDMSTCSPATEAGIVACRTGIAPEDAHRIVAMLRTLAAHSPLEAAPSLRTAVMIGRLTARLGLRADACDGTFVQICLDVLENRAPRGTGPHGRPVWGDRLRAAIARTCPPVDSLEDIA